MMDGVIKEFTVRRKTVRWPLLIAFNMIDVSWNNAFILLSKGDYKNTRKNFLRKLSFQMAYSFASLRLLRKNISTEIRIAGLLVGFVSSEQPVDRCDISGPHRALRCVVCKKWSRSRCCNCNVTVCPRHRIQLKKDFCEKCK